MKWYFYIPGVSFLVNKYWEWRCARAIRQKILRGEYDTPRVLPMVEASTRLKEAYDILQKEIDRFTNK